MSLYLGEALIIVHDSLLTLLVSNFSSLFLSRTKSIDLFWIRLEQEKGIGELLKHEIVLIIHIHYFYYGLLVHNSLPLLPCGFWRYNHRIFRRERLVMQMLIVEIPLLHLNTALILFMGMYHTKSWLWTLKNDNFKREFYFGQKKFRKKDQLTFLFTLIEYACIIYKIAYIIYLKLSIY